MNVGSLFSGAGLLDLGLAQAGHRHGWFVERDEHRRAILGRRFPGVPVHDDVRTVGAHNLGPVDCIAGGFPCKGASSAGKRTGLAHPETALWAEFERIVRELQPRWVVVENVAAILTIHGGDVWRTVLGDLVSLGYDVVWDCVPAAAVGAPHGRDRVFAFARHADGARLEGHGRHDERANERIAGAAGSRTEVAADPERLGRAARPGLRAGTEGRGPRAERRGRPDDGGVQAVADTEREHGELRGGAGDVGAPSGGGRGTTRKQWDRDAVADRAEAAADADRGRREAGAQQDSDRPTGRQPASFGDDAHRRGVRVEWGEYEPAIRRWEAIHGPAPEPLVRRMDDGSPGVRRMRSRMDRQRLSALGDGVHVHVGRLVGEALAMIEGGD